MRATSEIWWSIHVNLVFIHVMWESVQYYQGIFKTLHLMMISLFASWMQGLRHPFLEQWKSDGLTKFLSGSHFYFRTHYTGFNDKSPWKIKKCNFTFIHQSYILFMITIKCDSGSRSGDKSEAYNTFKDSPAVYSLTAHSDSLGSIPK